MFMAMAHLEGETLEGKITEGLLKLDEAVDLLTALSSSKRISSAFSHSYPPPSRRSHSFARREVRKT